MFASAPLEARSPDPTRHRPIERLFIAYVPGFDHRRVDAEVCPHVAKLHRAYPTVTFKTPATSDSMPTLLTGAYPHQHGIWGPKLPRSGPARSPWSGIVDALPDLATTTFQCVQHVVLAPVDMAGVPPRRRRRFEMCFFKHVKTRGGDVTAPINGQPTMFSVAGQGRSRFSYLPGLRGLDRHLPSLAAGDHALEMVEIHCLDQIQHWMADREDAVRSAYRQVDDFLEKLHTECLRSGRAFVFLSDHGSEPVKDTIDLAGALRRLELRGDEYDFYIENTRARFWLHTPRARSKVMELLESIPHSQVLSWQDLERFGIRFPSGDFGEVYLYPAPGYILFPNDFHHVLANRILALYDLQQRPRFFRPAHRSDHGYLPHAESETGFMVLADEDFAPRSSRIDMVDIAPTVLALLGIPPANTMCGQPAFQRRVDR